MGYFVNIEVSIYTNWLNWLQGGKEMFQVGDLIIYSLHGICHIDEICEKTILGVTRKYYILHPLEDPQLIISTPVNNDQGVMLGMMNQDEAEEILESFKLPGIQWIEKVHDRSKAYSGIIKTGDRIEISKIVNTLMRKKVESERNGKKLGEIDRKLLEPVQKIMFTELAFSLNSTFDSIFQEVSRLISLDEEARAT